MLERENGATAIKSGAAMIESGAVTKMYAVLAMKSGASPIKSDAVAMSSGAAVVLWSGTNKYRDVSTGPLARPFARSLAPLTRGKENY